MMRVAEPVPPLHKLFWLIGSGNIHEDQDVGKDGARKKQFIEAAR
jgi:hypothetical protein